MHLASATQKYPFPATICGLPVLRYMVVDKNHDNSTIPTDTLCPECVFRLDEDLVIDEQREHRWSGKTAMGWAMEHERVTTESKEYELKCRELSIDLGASREEALELHRQLETWKKKPRSLISDAVVYLLGGRG